MEVVDMQTYLVTGLALLATYLCNRFGFHAELPSGLIGIAIIFPIEFSINAAYRRREEALRYFASIKAHAVAIVQHHSREAFRGLRVEVEHDPDVTAVETSMIIYVH